MGWCNSLSPPAPATIVSAIVSAVVALVLAFVGPFSQRWLERLKGDLAKDLESEKAELSHTLEKEKAALQADLVRDSAAAQGAIRLDVELLLGERASQREYEFEARKALSGNWPAAFPENVH